MQLDKKTVYRIMPNPMGSATAGVLLSYVSGCITRERERIAEILRKNGVDQKICEGILSDRDDERVFKWRGPGSPLNAPKSKVSARSSKTRSRTRR